MTDHHYVYGASGAQTVHLIRFHDTIVFPNPAALCGGKGLIQGDETLSGIAATCGRCRQIAHLPKEYA